MTGKTLKGLIASAQRYAGPSQVTSIVRVMKTLDKWTATGSLTGKSRQYEQGVLLKMQGWVIG
jgi:hypothetical protein